MPRPTPERFQRIALIGRHGGPASTAPLAELVAFLRARGHAVSLDADTARAAGIDGVDTIADDALPGAVRPRDRPGRRRHDAVDRTPPGAASACR